MRCDIVEEVPPQNSSVIVRPGENKPDRSLEKMASYSPDIMRQTGIMKMMEGCGTLCRVSRDEIILEGLVDASIALGMNLPATKTLITSTRTLSPGLDGLGRGEAVKCLMTAAGPTYMPGMPFGEERGPGMLARLFAFVTGTKTKEGQK